MTTSNQLNPGMTISVNNVLYRVENVVKVATAKGAPFIKTKLKNLHTQELVEKSFKLNQSIKDVALVERRLEFLYPEGKDFLFLDVINLDQVLIPQTIATEGVGYLKEGIELKAFFYGDTIFSIELPQFLELMVAKIQQTESTKNNPSTRIAILETGAKVEIPPFIETGDIIKVDTKVNEYIQRV